MSKISLCLFILIWAFQAQAGLFLEPFANRVGGQWSQEASVILPSTTTYKSEGDLTGYQYGGRAGYIWDNFNLSLQISAGKGKLKSNKQTSTSGGTSLVTNLDDINFNRTDNGMVLGYKFGPMFRMWFSALTANLKAKESDGTITKYKGVTGLLGFGWYIGQIVSINLEFGGSLYSEENGKSYPITDSSSGSTTVHTQEYKETLFLFGVSIPLGLY